MPYNEDKNFWGIPYGTEITAEAFVKDIWDPSTEEILTPKQFFGLGWGINLHALGRRVGVIK
ncbi:hypothetical protein LEP1GSC195_2507 [Leptospira wolbachii serovar Codice str. CDC]|uniref:Uncharacterized protein n=3 Tax=Leptospira TaxID=171 RepID=R9A2N8_9LEPT|nr:MULTISPECIES: DUF5808 domain-containing protein [Leptospira]EMY69320.1 hypothetical protein LEP1GSC199_4157 [Leptospira vanthielii serovar Holland str. Waz Holland = ATCC 700522]EOQ96491.1 hypothetical protein LEP1GSC195_2507 [Leptospira wolbachii serovar Codice str. CDC]TGM59201.1 hypothetical protein EHQ95_05685 [Leptospira vanthielii]